MGEPKVHRVQADSELLVGLTHGGAHDVLTRVDLPRDSGVPQAGGVGRIRAATGQEYAPLTKKEHVRAQRRVRPGLDGCILVFAHGISVAQEPLVVKWFR
ncbi:hypothetical protein NOSIN_06825 [Nocardiopsis sinuspersici]|uniref:Uncharacterized protein n=1 Tax=Nocardiopsis sinuspersici TaxID=501010 RepID=A0A1V3BYC8_9ACTN|nr:hypothetical protein NOSIN_06825 [Nocardiopsis sinuspersici]